MVLRKSPGGATGDLFLVHHFDLRAWFTAKEVVAMLMLAKVKTARAFMIGGGLRPMSTRTATTMPPSRAAMTLVKSRSTKTLSLIEIGNVSECLETIAYSAAVSRHATARNTAICVRGRALRRIMLTPIATAALVANMMANRVFVSLMTGSFWVTKMCVGVIIRCWGKRYQKDGARAWDRTRDLTNVNRAL